MKTYTLKNPVKSVTGAEIKEVKIRPPLVRDFRNASKRGTGEVEQLFHFVSVLGEIAPEDLDNFHLEDFTAIAEIVKDFLPKESPTSET